MVPEPQKRLTVTEENAQAGHTALPFLCLTAIVFVAGVLRFWGLGAQSLWLDEAYSGLIARMGLWEGLLAQLDDSSPPLFYWLLKLPLALFGESAWSLRVLSAVSGTATVLALLCWRRRGERPWLAAGFLAISPLHLYYSQEARMYALLALVALFGWMAIDRAVRRRSQAAMGLAALWGVAAVHLHAYGFFMVVGQVLVAAFATRSVALLRPWRWAALACMPWLAVTVNQTLRLHSTWQPPTTLESTARSLTFLTCQSWGTPGWPGRRYLLLAGVLSAIALAAIGAWQQRRKPHWWLPAAGALPVALAWGASWLRPLYVPGRYDSMALPFVAVAVGWGLQWAMEGRRRWLLAVPLALAIASEHLNYRLRYRKSADRAAADAVAALSEDGTLVIAGGLTGTSLLWRLPQMTDRSPPILRFPESELGWIPQWAHTGEEPQRSEATAQLHRVLEERRPRQILYIQPATMAWAVDMEPPPGYRLHGFIGLKEGDNLNQPDGILVWQREAATGQP